MQKAKNVIKEMFRQKRALYEPYTNLIKARWDKHLKIKLHATTYWFNPIFRYDEKFCDKRRVTESVVDLLEKRAFCQDLTKAISETKIY